MREWMGPVLLAAGMVGGGHAGSAHGADYVALPESTLGFSTSFQGEAFDGKFARFTP